MPISTQRDPIAENCRSLGLAVLELAIMEATGKASTTADNRERAKRWLTGTSEDLKEICAIAGLNWRAVVETSRRKLWRKPKSPESQ
jgi:hypothetical protein